MRLQWDAPYKSTFYLLTYLLMFICYAKYNFFFFFWCRLSRGNSDVCDAWQAVHQRHVLLHLRPLQRTFTNRGPQRRTRNSFNVRSYQQHGLILRRRTSGRCHFFWPPCARCVKYLLRISPKIIVKSIASLSVVSSPVMILYDFITIATIALTLPLYR